MRTAAPRRLKVYLNVAVHVSVRPRDATNMSTAIKSGRHIIMNSAKEKGSTFVIAARTVRGTEAILSCQKSANGALTDATVLTVSPNDNITRDTTKNGEKSALSLFFTSVFVIKQTVKLLWYLC